MTRGVSYNGLSVIPAAMILAITLPVVPAEAQNLLVDPSFESNPLGNYSVVLNDFVGQQGVWGPEAATITGAQGGVTPFDGVKMLRMTNDGLSVTQCDQVIDVSSYAALIDGGGATFSLSGRFNVDGLPAALCGIVLRSYTGSSLGLTNGVASSGDQPLDTDAGTWETVSVNGVIPTNTRWIAVELYYRNSSIGGMPGYVDAVDLRIGAIYTDRAAWQAATSGGSTLCEDFEAEPNATGWSTFTMPYTTAGGVTIDRLAGGTGQQFIRISNNGTQAPHIRDFTAGITWTPGHTFTAFGFDYRTAHESWQVEIDLGGGPTTIATLSSWSQGFIGFVLPSAGVPSFTLRGGLAGGAQGGIDVDNMCFALEAPPPCPPCPPAGSLNVTPFLITGNASGTGWSWAIEQEGGPARFCAKAPCVTGVMTGDDVDGDGFNGTPADVATRFANSINDYSTANGCFFGLSALVQPILPPIPPLRPIGAKLFIYYESSPAPLLFVGPCGDALCPVLFNLPSSGCPFNPTIYKIVPSGQDCNSNGEDDVVDILLGQSQDANQDRVPDECQTEAIALEPGPNSCPSAAPLECKGCGRKSVGSSDAVNLFSGEVTRTSIDLHVAGRGMDFAWQLKYRSRVGPDSSAGTGWDSAYNMRLQQDGPDLKLSDGQGRLDRYVPEGAGLWRAAQFFREIQENMDGTHTLIFENTGKWIFRSFDASPSAGKIQQIVDRNGNPMDFAYDGSGKLTTITDTLGKNVTIGYDADGRVVSVTDCMGRQTTHAYYQMGDPDGSPGDLKSITTPSVTGTPNGNDFPLGKTTAYTYTTGFVDNNLNHDLLTVTNPKGQTYLQIVYAHTIDAGDPRHTMDPANINYDRVVRRVLGDSGDIIDYAYVPLTPDSSNSFAVLRVIVNDRVGNVFEHFYDGQNRHKILREYTGRAPDSDAPTTDVDNRPVSPLRPTDPAFFETRYEYNTDALVTRIIHPNGNEETFVYDELNPDPRARGNLLQHCRLPGSLGGDQAQICETFEYDTGMGGCCGTNFVTRHVDGRGNETLHAYDGTGNCTQTTNRISSIVEDFEYNGFGQLTAHVLPTNGSGHRRRDELTYYAAGPQTGFLKDQIVDATGFALKTTRQYDCLGRVTRLIDARGHDTLYTYNALDQVTREQSREVTDGSGLRYETLYWYDANDNLVRRDIQNVDDLGVLQSNSHFSTLNEYDLLNYLTRTCSEVGSASLAPSVVTCGAVPASEFITTEYDYDANRNQSLVRSGEAVNGNQPTNVVEKMYDERDLVFREVRAPSNPAQSTTQYDYDANGNRVSAKQGLEDTPRVTAFAYDGYDRVVNSIDAMGNVSSFHYDANGNRTSVRVDGEAADVAGSAGNIRLSERTDSFDAMDRQTRSDVAFFNTITQVLIGDGLATTQMFYSDNSQIIRVIDDNGHQTQTSYDTANRRRVVLDAKANVSLYAYDENSNMTSVTSTEKSDIGAADQVFVDTMSYDNLDRLVQRIDNVGSTTHFGYDSRGNRTVMTDALNHETCFEYDGLSRLIATIRDMDDDGADGDDSDITTTQIWDDSSRLIGQGDDNGNVTQYQYDALNRKVGEQYADGTAIAFDLDVHGNIVGITDANGSVATKTYDLLNRVVNTSVAPGPGVSDDTTLVAMEYDGLSRLVQADDDDSTMARSYDSLSNVLSETLNGETTLCSYDGDRNKLQCTYPGGRIITCTYDSLDRKETIFDQAGLIASYDYVGPSRVERREYGNGTRTDYAYDGILPNPTNDYGVKQIVGTAHTLIGSGQIIDDRTYTWDRTQNKSQRKDARTGGPQLNHDYSYDFANRLTQTTVTDSAASVVRDTGYSLDGVGNRTLVTGAPDSGAYSMNPATPEPADFQMNQYSVTPVDARAYDRNGNLISTCMGGDADLDGVMTLADVGPFVEALVSKSSLGPCADVNGDGKLDGLDIQPFVDLLLGPALPATGFAIQYDYANRMVSYEDRATNKLTQYAYDALGRRIQKVLDALGTPQTTRYFYDGWRVIEEQTGAGATMATYVHGLYIDEVLNMQRGGQNYSYHADDLYNIMAVTNAAGAVVERYEYQDYGAPSIFDAAGTPIAQSMIGNPYLFTGREYDADTAWYNYRTRYLDARGGRFTTRDTIGGWGDRANVGNVYTYGSNGPVTRRDPTGMVELLNWGNWSKYLTWDQVQGFGGPDVLFDRRWPYRNRPTPVVDDDAYGNTNAFAYDGLSEGQFGPGGPFVENCRGCRSCEDCPHCCEVASQSGLGATNNEVEDAQFIAFRGGSSATNNEVEDAQFIAFGGGTRATNNEVEDEQFIAFGGPTTTSCGGLSQGDASRPPSITNSELRKTRRRLERIDSYDKRTGFILGIAAPGSGGTRATNNEVEDIQF